MPRRRPICSCPTACGATCSPSPGPSRPWPAGRRSRRRCAVRSPAPSPRISASRRAARRRVGSPAPAANASRRSSNSTPRSAPVTALSASCPTSHGRLRAWTVNTNLHELRGHEEQFKRRAEPDSTRDFGAENWSDRLARQRAFCRPRSGRARGRRRPGRAFDRRAAAAARHRHADRRPPRAHRRQLAQALSFADAAQRSARQPLPYMPFPPTWPVYIPKDMLANWFEVYVDALELNFWTGTALAGGSYDDERRQWNVTLRRADGSRARHAPAPSDLRDRREQHSHRRPTCPGSPSSPAPWCIPALSTTPSSGAAARRWCSAPAPAAMTSRRNCTRTAPTSPSSSAARRTSSA